MARKSNFSGAMKAAQESGVLRKCNESSENQEDVVESMLSAVASSSQGPTPGASSQPEPSVPSQLRNQPKSDAPKWFKMGKK